MLFENFVLVSLLLNCILLFLQLEVIILDLGQENFRSQTLVVNKKKINSRASARLYFYQEDSVGVVSISLFSQATIQTLWTYHVIEY